jgi:hypothetical protein
VDGRNEQSATLGWGVTLGAQIKAGERDDVRFQAATGDGLGRYVAFGLSNGAVVTDTREIEAIPSYLGWIGYRHFWTGGLRTNVNVSGFRGRRERKGSSTRPKLTTRSRLFRAQLASMG